MSLLLLTILLVQGSGVLTGRLLSVDGTPLPGVRVAAVEASDPGSTMASLAQTDSAGRYRLENVPPGRYYILAGTFAFQSYYPGVGTLKEAEVVAVTAGTAISVRDFKFSASSGIMRAVREPSQVSGRFFGIVRDTQGSPLRNFTVMLSDIQRGIRVMTSTSAAGAFEFSGLPAGALSMEILSPVQSGYRNGGYEQLKVPITITTGESLQQEIRLRLVLESGWQQRPDAYARPASRTRASGVPPRLGVGSLRQAAAQRDPLPYPSSLKAEKIENSVALECVVGIDGTVVSLRAVSLDANPDLVRAAIEAASRWTFYPVKRGDEPAEQSGLIDVYFTRTK